MPIRPLPLRKTSRKCWRSLIKRFAPSGSTWRAGLPDRRLVGVIVSVVLAATLWMIPLPGNLGMAGRQTLVITLFTVVWWVFAVVPPAYATLLMLVSYLVLGLATPEVVFRIWTLPLMWLIIASFLIAAAVTKSGLAQRVAYFFMIRYATSYRSLVVLTYVLGFLLSLLIPHPFPRALLLMAIIGAIIRQAGMNRADALSLIHISEPTRPY